jgi:ABC-type multidrug transport system fused ATPase/permease subunit
MLISTLANVLGAIILVAIIEPYFLLVVLVVATVYVQLAGFYRKSALSFKRIDALLRSPLYAHFSESLSGLSVIRSYGVTDRFIDENCRLMSIENRSYYPTIVNQRWLGLRLDALGTCLTFAISLFVVLNRSISPASGGLALSYMVTVQQSLSWLCRQYAE